MPHNQTQIPEENTTLQQTRGALEGSFNLGKKMDSPQANEPLPDILHDLKKAEEIQTESFLERAKTANKQRKQLRKEGKTPSEILASRAGFDIARELASGFAGAGIIKGPKFPKPSKVVKFPKKTSVSTKAPKIQKENVRSIEEFNAEQKTKQESIKTRKRFETLAQNGVSLTELKNGMKFGIVPPSTNFPEFFIIADKTGKVLNKNTSKPKVFAQTFTDKELIEEFGDDFLNKIAPTKIEKKEFSLGRAEQELTFIDRQILELEKSAKLLQKEIRRKETTQNLRGQETVSDSIAFLDKQREQFRRFQKQLVTDLNKRLQLDATVNRLTQEINIEKRLRDRPKKATAEIIDFPKKELQLVNNPTTGELPSDVVKVFSELGENQRGAPENVMLKIKFRNGGGVLNPVVERAGDIIHRMTHGARYNTLFTDVTLEKVEILRRSLNHKYGFEREMRENIIDNAKAGNETFKKLKTDLDKLLTVYAKEHKKLTVYNRPQFLAREIAISVGEQNFSKARQLTNELYDLITKTPKQFEIEARQVFRDSKGKIVPFTKDFKNRPRS